jgi:Type II secretory pathway, ATPase PulE/Tfp pilus assembly pathway, ATPase PilB
LSRRVEPTEASLSEFTNWVRAKEVLLRQYFILTPVTGSELRRLVGFPRNPSTIRLIAVLALIDFAGFLFMGIYGLIALVVLNALTIKARHNYSVIKGGELGRLSHRLTASGLLFTKPSEEDLRSIAEAFIAGNNNFMLSISGNPQFRGEVARTVVSSHTKLIVHENPKAIPKASQWAMVLERINERGEEPVRAMLALDRQSSIPLLFTTRTTTQMHLWSMPSIDELGYDLAVIPIFHGGRVLSESLRARVYLGRDRENNELWIDLDSLPSGFGLVVGPTGMGKTKTMKRILLELVGRGINVLILDPHGEYLRIPLIEPIDVTRKFINMFELDGVTDAERINRLLLNFEVLGIRPESILPDLKAIYANGLYKDFFKSMEFIRARSDDELVGLALDSWCRIWATHRLCRRASCSTTRHYC